MFLLARQQVQISVSHQMALYILSDNQKQQLQHIVKACDIISEYEKNSHANGELLLSKYLCILENKNLDDSSSIFNTTENGVSQSLRAYLCHAIINWFNKYKFKEEEISEYTNLVIPILEKCVQDLLNYQAVEYWNTTSEISKLETQLSLHIGKLDYIKF